MKPLPLSQGQIAIVFRTPTARGFRARSHWESDQTSSTRLKPWRCQGTGHQVEGSFHPPTLPQPQSLSAQASVHTGLQGRVAKSASPNSTHCPQAFERSANRGDKATSTLCEWRDAVTCTKMAPSSVVPCTRDKEKVNRERRFSVVNRN